MSKLLSGLLSLGQRNGGAMMDYDDAKKRAADEKASVRRKLAKRANVQPEILYFLAEDADADVRREIAANPSTPVQADQMLSTDKDDSVRSKVAEKVARLAPNLSTSERERAGDIVTDILQTLARDETAQIRRILAEELKSAVGVPESVVQALARDDDEEVCVPVLRESPLLTDEFLIEIIESDPVRAALQAVSARDGLGADVADAIVGTEDQDAITSLLSNRGAQIREETLDRLVDGAMDVDDWHAPLVSRPSLSNYAVGALSRFVTHSLLERLADRQDLTPELAETLSDAVRSRVEETRIASSTVDEDEAGIDAARKLFQSGKLDEKMVGEAVKQGRRLFVMEAIALKAELPTAIVRKAFSMATAKGVSAVAWKAGLSADLALQMQLRLARIPPSEALEPVAGEYALPEDDLNWQIDFLGG